MVRDVAAPSLKRYHPPRATEGCKPCSALMPSKTGGLSKRVFCVELEMESSRSWGFRLKGADAQTAGGSWQMLVRLCPSSLMSALADGGRAELSSLVKTCLVDLFFADITYLRWLWF